MNKIISGFKKSINAYLGLRMLNRIIKRNPEGAIFLAVLGLGDICYAFAYLSSIKKIYGKIIVVTSIYSRELVSFYPCIDEVITVNPCDTIKLKSLIFSRIGKKIFDSYDLKHRVFSCNPWGAFPIKIMYIPKITFLKLLKHVTYELNENAPIDYPQVKYCSLEKFGIANWEKVVLINPHSNFLNTDSDIFKQISKQLIAKGYVVYTNISKSYPHPIEGTLPMNCNLQELFNIVKKIRLFVSVRSGLLDFVVSAGGRLLVIYDWDENGLFKKAYNLDDWTTNSMIAQYDSNQTNSISSYLEQQL